MDKLGREIKTLKTELKRLEAIRAAQRKEYRKQYYLERLAGPDRVNPWRKNKP